MGWPTDTKHGTGRSAAKLTCASTARRRTGFFTSRFGCEEALFALSRPLEGLFRPCLASFGLLQPLWVSLVLCKPLYSKAFFGLFGPLWASSLDLSRPLSAVLYGVASRRIKPRSPNTGGGVISHQLEPSIDPNIPRELIHRIRS